MAVQDMPAVPAAAPTPEVEEILDLPDVPTKAPTAASVAVDDAETSSKKGGIYISLSVYPSAIDMLLTNGNLI